MKKVIITALVGIFLFMGVILRPNMNHAAWTMVSGGYANSQVDTIYYTRNPFLTALAFSPHWKDSVSITNVIVRRIVQGEWIPVLLGDTVTAFSALVNTATAGVQGSAANPSTVRSGAVVLTPYTDVLAIIVTYAATQNGLVVGTAKVDYMFQQTLSF